MIIIISWWIYQLIVISLNPTRIMTQQHRCHSANVTEPLKKRKIKNINIQLHMQVFFVRIDF